MPPASVGVAAFLAVTPAFAVAGIVRGVRNGQVNDRIEDRQSKLPAAIAAGEEQALDLFFPLSPSPTRIQITYADAQGASHQLDIDTSKTLAGLHLAPDPEQRLASHARALRSVACGSASTSSLVRSTRRLAASGGGWPQQRPAKDGRPCPSRWSRTTLPTGDS